MQSNIRTYTNLTLELKIGTFEGNKLLLMHRVFISCNKQNSECYKVCVCVRVCVCVCVYVCVYIVLTDSLIGFTGPYKLLGTTKTLVPQCHGRVDDVLSITAHCHKPTQRGMELCINSIILLTFH